MKNIHKRVPCSRNLGLCGNLHFRWHSVAAWIKRVLISCRYKTLQKSTEKNCSQKTIQNQISAICKLQFKPTVWLKNCIWRTAINKAGNHTSFGRWQICKRNKIINKIVVMETKSNEYLYRRGISECHKLNIRAGTKDKRRKMISDRLAKKRSVRARQHPRNLNLIEVGGAGLRGSATAQCRTLLPVGGGIFFEKGKDASLRLSGERGFLPLQDELSRWGLNWRGRRWGGGRAAASSGGNSEAFAWHCRSLRFIT